MEAQILTWITFIPLIGMTAILFLPKSSLGAIKGISLVATAIPLVLATWLYFGLFQKGSADLQFIQDVTWIAAIDAHYKVGVDGLSLALVWLTTLLLFIGVPASFGMEKAGKAYYALLLLLEVGILGVFVSLDLFLFYVFWEVMLLPMYFLIGIWGGPRREYAAIKFFLYTLAGSVLMLVAIVALRLDSGTFDVPRMVEMAAAGQLTGASLPGGGELAGMQFSTWVLLVPVRGLRHQGAGVALPHLAARRPRRGARPRSRSSWPASCSSSAATGCCASASRSCRTPSASSPWCWPSSA